MGDRTSAAFHARHMLSGLVLLASACSHPRLVSIPPPEPFPIRQQLEIWRGRDAATWHAVSIQGDSLGGVPVHLSPTCDSCRVRVSLKEVDSVRAVSVERSALLLHGMVLGFTTAALVALRLSEGD